MTYTASYSPRHAGPATLSCYRQASRLLPTLRLVEDPLNNKMVFLAVAVLVAAPSPALGQEAPSPEEVVLAFHEALASGDSVTALKLLAEDVVIYESGGVEASREEVRAHHWPADMAFTSSTEREVTVERIGKSGDLAWVLSRSTTTGTFMEQEIHAQERTCRDGRSACSIGRSCLYLYASV